MILVMKIITIVIIFIVAVIITIAIVKMVVIIITVVIISIRTNYIAFPIFHSVKKNAFLPSFCMH